MSKTKLKNIILLSLLIVLIAGGVLLFSNGSKKTGLNFASILLSETTNTYYVDATNGNDNNNGTSESSPWKTIAKVNSSSFQPGDQILFKRGETWREQLTVSSSGTADKPITFGAYGSGASPLIKRTNSYSDSQWSLYYDNGGRKIWKADYSLGGLIPRGLLENGERRTNIYISGSTNPESVLENMSSGPWEGKFYYRKDSGVPSNTEVGTRHYAILIQDKTNVIVDGINCEGPGASPSSLENYELISAGGSSENITIKNLKLSKSSKKGILSESTTKNINYYNLIATDCQSTGINMDSQRGSIIGCKSYDNGRLNADSGDRGGIGSYQGGNITIKANEVYRNAQDNQDADFEITIVGAIGQMTITRNYVHDCIQGCIQIAQGGDNSVIAYNIISRFGSTTADPTTVTSGKFGGIRIGGGAGGIPVANVKVLNNIIYGGQQAKTTNHAGLTVQLVSTNLTVKNNIFFQNISRDIFVKSDADVTGADFNNNIFYKGDFSNNWHWKGTSYSTLNDWQNNTLMDSKSMTSNPMFIDAANNNFHLQSTSPAINKGTNAGLTADYEGNLVPQGSAPDIGAYEYAGAEPPPDTTPPAPPTGLLVN